MRILKKLVFSIILTAAAFTASADINLPDDSDFVEVHVLSLQFFSKELASMVARPCDENSKCDDIVARIDTNTTWLSEGEQITSAQAKRLQWKFALLVIDKHKNALLLNRIRHE